ncbi:hypothetical protein ACQ86N_47430 [Puia sp. P3]|uniref:hypothetical protein n=1 Tax=Puia sp. P3 TaxID=3423952 RepID=UPI003D665B8D
MQASVVRGDVNAQQINADRQLAAFWKDSVQDGYLLYAHYSGEAAKLEKSEKVSPLLPNYSYRDCVDRIIRR